MPALQNYSLKEKLRDVDEELKNSPALLGMTMLTFPNYINSMRSTMFTAHLNQFLNLLKPQFPYVFTNNENTVGKNSSGYKKAKSDLYIDKKVVKFEALLDSPRIYKIFVWDYKKERYDVITRNDSKDLIENFGYEYNNTKIDSYEEGDTIKEGTVLYRSTSYSDDMNYSYGRNVTVAYTLDPFTSEDAAIISRSLSKDFSSIETEEITIALNSNDFLLNLYGDKKHYIPLPKIGQRVSSVLAASRRQFNNQLLFDFKTSALMTIHEGEDNVFYCDNDVEIIDYTIFDNNDERIGNSFYTQINELIDAQDDYYREILEECEKIRNSGCEYTREVDYEYKRARDFFDKKKKWREGDSNFGNIEIKVKIKRVAPMVKGCKLTGRCGNKSVVSEIWEDEDMPYTKDGRRVDLLLNLLAIINRTTAWVLFELFINGCSYQVRQKMKELPFKEQEEMLFDYIRIWNEKQADKFYNNYKKKTKKEKEKYINDAIYDGIYIHQNAMWESTPVFYRCLNVRKKFPFIKMNDLYIKKWGKEQKILEKYFIGEMYILKSLRLQLVIIVENSVNCWKLSMRQSAA